MMRSLLAAPAAKIVAGLCAVVLASPALGQNWINFVNETSTRLVADPGLVLNDPQEKDYAYADFDHDGDVDLVIVRKTPFSVAGRQRNVLLMNEGTAQGHSINGVLVDRTDQYGTAATDGGLGLKDLTDDRDVFVVDVNNDGWADFVTATTYGNGLPKTISHPRVYMNLGWSAGPGTWQGFRYEEARFPNLGGHPNFCGLGAGDVNGDKFPDLYFVDYDNVVASPFDDRLLINNGAGSFSDQTAARVPVAFSTSSFGTTANIIDMNGDGKADIVKSENGPIKTAYNNGTGNFPSTQATYNGAAYHASVGDLNGDGRFDIIASDDSTDQYLLNTTPGGAAQSSFSNLSFPNSGGFGSVSRTVDMNNDGFNDVIICDVDVDASGCSRVTKVFRNLGPSNWTMADQAIGGMTAANFTGCYDVAVIDLDQDGWKDMVIGRCNSTQIWRQVPPSGLVFTYPQGLPGFLPSQQTYPFQVQVAAVGGTPAPGTGVMHYSINGGSWVDAPMTVVSGNLYSTQLPAVNCTDIVRFYVTAQLSGGGTFSDPSSGATAPYQAIAADGEQITLTERFELPAPTWTVQNGPSLTAGAWGQADPNGTVNVGGLASPEDDAGANLDVMCFVTENGPPGGAANANDVDGGPTSLISPTIDLAGTDATISYQRWFYSLPNNDVLRTEVSNNNGGSWVLVHQTTGTGSAWEGAEFRVGQFVTPTAQVRVRFVANDTPNDSVTEAGIDNFIVEELVCGIEPCPADVTGDDTVNITDLLAVIAAWGQPGGPADVNGDNTVNITDLLAVIAAWGACP